LDRPEAIIIGGGPAGSTLAAFLARAGVQTLLLESERHPREHVGESMVTATTRIFSELGFLPTMEREGFVRKYGASWHAVGSSSPLRVVFAEVDQPGIDQNYTYQVDRARFDKLLLDHARGFGARVREETQVRRVLFEGDRAAGVEIEGAAGPERIAAPMVFDASGRRTLLGAQLRLKRPDPNFDQFAVHGWFRGVDRGANPSDIHIHFLPVRRGWVWQIPITDEITSVGVVAERAEFLKGKRRHEAWFAELCAGAPGIAAAMAAAEAVKPLKVEADYSYEMTALAGDGWMLVGDAARFVDPIFSSGVSVAMHGAKFAAEAYLEGRAQGRLDAEAFAPYVARLRAGTAIWYEFITLYYRLMPVFTRFISHPRHRAQVIQLLQGDVYDRRSAPVLEEMRRFVETVEGAEDHLLHDRLDASLRLSPTPDGKFSA